MLNTTDVLSLRDTFRNRGVVRIEKLLDPAKVTQAVRAVQIRMESAGIWKDGEWRVDHLRNEPINEGAKFARQIKGCLEVNELVNDEIPQVVAQLLDRQKTFTGMEVPQPLFTLPNSDKWDVPHDVWHLDAPRLPNWGIPGIQIFTFLNTVAPAGGGTLVVAGSHRLVNGSERIRSRDVKRRLKKEPYFRDLMSKTAANRDRFLQNVERCGDVDVQVLELVGQPGDVYFVDLRVLHAPAPNATLVPRVMLTRRFFLESVRDMIYSHSMETETAIDEVDNDVHRKR